MTYPYRTFLVNNNEIVPELTYVENDERLGAIIVFLRCLSPSHLHYPCDNIGAAVRSSGLKEARRLTGLGAMVRHYTLMNEFFWLGSAYSSSV